MKHKFSITLILLSMFLVTQLLGLIVISMYAPTTSESFNQTSNQNEITIERPNLPFGLDTEKSESTTVTIISIIIPLIFAFLLFSILMKYKLNLAIRIWFITVIIISIGISIYPILRRFTDYPSIAAIIITLPLVYYKVIKPNIIVHNATELLIYPGIAVVFISIFFSPINTLANILIIISLLILISLYDAWAVWKSGIMQKMAKYQMEELKIFGGFLIPTISPKDREKIQKLKSKYKNKKIPKEVQKRKFKVNLAILGGGDIIFPIITAGTFMWTFPKYSLFGIAGLIPALFIVAGATLGLIYLFAQTEKGKAYPAMPYITTGIFLGMIAWYFTLLL